MTHDHHGSRDELPDFFGQRFWDEKYSADEQLWSGAPNPHLTTIAASLEPGSALDVGSGEGADAIWLGKNGWRVRGLDISPVALTKAADHARAAGVEAVVEWQRTDLLEWTSPGPSYDLISSQFIHLPRESNTRLLKELAASVRRGGSLIVVGHHPDDPRHSAESALFEDIRFTAEQVLASVGVKDWKPVVIDRVEREWLDREGHRAIAVDAVLHAVRREA